MRIVFIILALFFVAMLQTTFVPRLALYGVFPNLMLVVIVYKSLFKDYKEILIWPLAGGLILDFFSAMPFGVFTLSFLIVSFLVSFLSRNTWSSENIGLVVVMVTLLGSFAFGLSAFFLTKVGFLLMGLSWAASLKQVLSIAFAEAGYNVGLAVVLFLILKKLKYAWQ